MQPILDHVGYSCGCLHFRILRSGGLHSGGLHSGGLLSVCVRRCECVRVSDCGMYVFSCAVLARDMWIDVSCMYRYIDTHTYIDPLLFRILYHDNTRRIWVLV